MAAAYIRGLSIRTRVPELEAHLREADLEELGKEEIQDILKIGESASIKLYNFKNTHSDMPRVKRALGFLKSVEMDNLLDIGSGRGVFLFPFLMEFPRVNVTSFREHYSEYPMISLDDIRETLNAAPTKNQGIVINSARDKTKEYLRKRQPFVWNATNLTPMLREKQINLFKSYNASIRIVFLETDWREQLRRNSERKSEVPENVISQMLGNLVLPERFEAHFVKWNCV